MGSWILSLGGLRGHGGEHLCRGAIRLPTISGRDQVDLLLKVESLADLGLVVITTCSEGLIGQAVSLLVEQLAAFTVPGRTVRSDGKLGDVNVVAGGLYLVSRSPE